MKTETLSGTSEMTISSFMKKNFRHFNAAVTVDAAQAWVDHLEGGGKMFLAMAGAMSSGELGISLAEMIRQDKVHAICCTGANLEEDVFNLIAHKSYERVPHYRDLSPEQEVELRDRGLNRVTDTCIPEEDAMRKCERIVLKEWQNAADTGERFFPYEFFYKVIRSKSLEPYYEIDPKNSWLVAACEKNLPIFTPGWEDSTFGNFYAARCFRGEFKRIDTVKSGIEQMIELIKWYRATAKESSIGFFQIGGGIAGDFPICVVPLILQDLKEKSRLWGYFCQISDSTTSYGSYSGAVPNEKITWWKLDTDTPKFVIESDATIVAPLIFSYVLGR